MTGQLRILGGEVEDEVAKWPSGAAGCELLSHSKELLTEGQLNDNLLLSAVDFCSEVMEKCSAQLNYVYLNCTGNKARASVCADGYEFLGGSDVKYYCLLHSQTCCSGDSKLSVSHFSSFSFWPVAVPARCLNFSSKVLNFHLDNHVNRREVSEDAQLEIKLSHTGKNNNFLVKVC